MKGFLKRFWAALTKPFASLNSTQWTVIFGGLFGASGPVANGLAKHFGLEAPVIVDILYWANYLTPTVIIPTIMSLVSDKAKVEDIAKLPAADQKEALNKVSDAAKVKIADAVDGVATVVLKDDVSGKLAALAESTAHPNIVTASQNEQDARFGVKQMTGPIPYNSADLDAMARTLWGEARGEPPLGQTAVAWVIRNRSVQSSAQFAGTKAGKEGAVYVVCHREWQFSCWFDAQAPHLQALRPEQMQKQIDICKAVLDGTAEDPTGGADHYHTIARPSYAKDWPPFWAPTITETAKVGAHVFYDSRRRRT